MEPTAIPTDTIERVLSQALARRVFRLLGLHLSIPLLFCLEETYTQPGTLGRLTTPNPTPTPGPPEHSPAFHPHSCTEQELPGLRGTG